MAKYVVELLEIPDNDAPTADELETIIQDGLENADVEDAIVVVNKR